MYHGLHMLSKIPCFSEAFLFGIDRGQDMERDFGFPEPSGLLKAFVRAVDNEWDYGNACFQSGFECSGLEFVHGAAAAPGAFGKDCDGIPVFELLCSGIGAFG